MKPVTFIIFGGTGDLAKRKLAPAFKQLEEDGIIPANSLLVGVGRSEYTSASYKEALLEHMPECKDGLCLPNINIQYVQTDSSKEDAFAELAEKLAEWEHPDTAQRIFYLATTYKIFGDIIQSLKKAQLHSFKDSSAKIVFEKPFGHNLESAKALEEDIHRVFEEEFVYRIDHYLGKETIQNVTALKYTNPIIEGFLNNTFVERIEVIADEDLGVGNRLGYYDGAGAVKDMIQSHLLQVASLILMNAPDELCSTCIHDEKVQVLKELALSEDGHTIGQYEGYQEELAAKELPTSNTETFARIKLTSSSERWKGVPIYLQTGKGLDKKEGLIIVTFKQQKRKEIENLKPNKLVIDIHPKEDIRVLFNTRKRESKFDVLPVELDFSSEHAFGPNTSDGYKILLKDIIHGHKTLFTREDELLESWRIIEDFSSSKDSLELTKYKKGSSPKDIYDPSHS